jgi:hypothetical protein
MACFAMVETKPMETVVDQDRLRPDPATMEGRISIKVGPRFLRARVIVACSSSSDLGWSALHP